MERLNQERNLFIASLFEFTGIPGYLGQNTFNLVSYAYWLPFLEDGGVMVLESRMMGLDMNASLEEEFR